MKPLRLRLLWPSDVKRRRTRSARAGRNSRKANSSAILLLACRSRLAPGPCWSPNRLRRAQKAPASARLPDGAAIGMGKVAKIGLAAVAALGAAAPMGAAAAKAALGAAGAATGMAVLVGRMLGARVLVELGQVVGPASVAEVAPVEVATTERVGAARTRTRTTAEPMPRGRVPPQGGAPADAAAVMGRRAVVAAAPSTDKALMEAAARVGAATAAAPAVGAALMAAAPARPCHRRNMGPRAPKAGAAMMPAGTPMESPVAMAAAGAATPNTGEGHFFTRPAALRR
mmetsp:Transcript_74517/g.209180  ORF Transcript_74517/g.209180 Transcript_74517/m.209180 type:complete len:286 (-) Transcript_74517:69-926(-)